MKLLDWAISTRVILVGTLLTVILAVAFPVKESAMWGYKASKRQDGSANLKGVVGGDELDAIIAKVKGAEAKGKFSWEDGIPIHQAWVPVVEEYATNANSFVRVPFPAPGPIGRAFILNQRQREIKLWHSGSVVRTSYFKEVPCLARIAFDVLFVILCGVGAAFIAHGRRLRPIGPSGGVGDSKLP